MVDFRQDFIRRNNIPRLYSKFALLNKTLSKVEKKGLYLEFGVYRGSSLTSIAARIYPNIIYGFDSFRGLPEDFTARLKKGAFGLDNAPDTPENARLVIGTFQETLEAFLKQFKDRIVFVHLDADVYSSTKFILDTLFKNNRIEKDTVLLFDELILREDGVFYTEELTAFTEAQKEYNFDYTWIGAYRSKFALSIK